MTGAIRHHRNHSDHQSCIGFGLRTANRAPRRRRRTRLRSRLRGAPPRRGRRCHEGRHCRHRDRHCASSHAAAGVAEVLGGAPAVGEAVVGVVAAENAGEVVFQLWNIPPMCYKLSTFYLAMSVKQPVLLFVFHTFLLYGISPRASRTFEVRYSIDLAYGTGPCSS